MTAIFAYSGCWWGVWSNVGGEAEQCRPEAWAVRGSASTPEAPLGRGGIATNVSSVCDVKNGHTAKFAMKHGFFVFKAEGRKLF